MRDTANRVGVSDPVHSVATSVYRRFYHFLRVFTMEIVFGTREILAKLRKLLTIVTYSVGTGFGGLSYNDFPEFDVCQDAHLIWCAYFTKSSNHYVGV